jgi:hypothetical protein
VEWATRFVVAVAAGWLGYLATTYSVAASLPNSEAERAHRLVPGDSRIAAALSEQLSGAEATAADRARADRIAQAALLRDPAAVEAVATLGINALARGDQASARRLFSYSQYLSRRDLRTQLWAIEDAVARGDITDVLKHYDIALRTKRDTPELLFPILASAISDPAIRSGLVKTLAARPIWTDDFVDYVSAHDIDSPSTAALFQGLRRARVSISEGASANLVNGLISDGHFEAAWSYYASIRRNVDRHATRDPEFAARLDIPAPFDWMPASVSGISTSIQQGTKGGVFDFAAPPSVGGLLLQQLQMLPPGDYVLEGHSIGIAQPNESLPYWTLSCREGSEFGRVIVPASAEKGGWFAGRMIVPANCPVQVLALVARPSTEIAGLAGQIDRVALRPIR